jgi:hypothetical protein
VSNGEEPSTIHGTAGLAPHIRALLPIRRTRSDSLILDECWLPDAAAVLQLDDMRPFRHTYLNWFWGSYTPVYLGVAQAAFDELRRVVHTRQPEGYAQPLAYHPDIRRHVAEMSADLEAARLITYRSAWLSDTEGPTAQTTAALYRAKYMVGEVVSRITRTALTLGGAHGILIISSDFGGNPPYEKMKQVARICFKHWLKQSNVLFLIGGKSNNTDIFVTFRAIADALREHVSRNGPTVNPEAIGEKPRTLAAVCGWLGT